MLNKESRFASYEEFERAVALYQKHKYVQLYKRDSRTLDASKKRTTQRNYNTKLKYGEITLHCIHGGRRFQTKSKGRRPNQHTFRKDCQAHIKLGTSDDGQYLIVRSKDEHHNHELKKNAFEHLPHQRRLDSGQKDHVKELLSLKANKKLLQNHLRTSLGQVVLLKDLHNIGITRSSEVSALEATAKELEEIPGAVVEIIVTEQNVLNGIFFQDKDMQQTFSHYPEILFIDATYKLNDMRMPLYLLIAEDGNGESVVVGVFVLVSEDAVSISEMARIFKKYNSKWCETVTIMADKDFTERQVFKAEFPDAKILICLFHVLRTFRRELTCDKMGITATERSYILNIVQEMAYARSYLHYEELYQKLIDSGLGNVVSYFNKNWHGIKEEWVYVYKNTGVTFQNQTNNRVECINQKLKAVITKYSSLQQFFHNLMLVIKSLRTEQSHRSISILQKVPVMPFEVGSTEHQYGQILTPYALEKVLTQLKTPTKENGEVQPSAHDCKCAFRHSMKLPCRHIFHVRRQNSQSLFCPELCAIRWTLAYHKKNSEVMSDNEIISHPATICMNVAKTKPITSQFEKFKKANAITQKLASIVSESSMREFENKIEVLEMLAKVWGSGGEVAWNANSQSETHDTGIVNVLLQCATDANNGTTGDDHTVEDTAHSSEQKKTVLIVEMTGTDKISSSNESTGQSRNLEPAIDTSICTSENNTPAVSGFVKQNIKPSEQLIDLTNITLPPQMKKRGRPKGLEQTVVGLRKKKKSDGPVRFSKKHPKDMERLMLSWFVSPTDTRAAILGKRLDRKSAKPDTRDIPNSCLDESVNIIQIKKYFTADGWTAIMKLYRKKCRQKEWYCGVCDELLDSNSICCDSCLRWDHFLCAGLNASPKQSKWFCDRCKN